MDLENFVLWLPFQLQNKSVCAWDFAKTKNKNEQESIPVGCQPPACQPYVPHNEQVLTWGATENITFPQLRWQAVGIPIRDVTTYIRWNKYVSPFFHKVLIYKCHKYLPLCIAVYTSNILKEKNQFCCASLIRLSWNSYPIIFPTMKSHCDLCQGGLSVWPTL